MAELLTDLVDCLRFWSRLPVPAGEAPHLARAVRTLPVAGALIALPAVAALLAAAAFGLSPLVSATAALATLVATTGALHEDGLADAADGLFGGSTPERRLAIMRDSRIGTFGALALGFSLLLRVGALAAIVSTSVTLAAAALVAGAAVSRTAGLLPLACLAPARDDGLGASVAAPDKYALQSAVVLSAVALTLPVAAGLSVSHAIVAGSLAVCAAYLPIPLARARIGGQTGDIAGASQQAGEIAFLLVLSAP